MVQEAISFAMEAHDGQLRKGSAIPYIKHPLEAAVIVSGISHEEDLIAAALLHDTIEDCGVTQEVIEERFGSHVAYLVAAESDDKNLPWVKRKTAKLKELSSAPEEVKIVALGDKLANLRDISRDYSIVGDKLWNRFSAGSKELVGWYYKGLSEALSSLSDMPQYREFCMLTDSLFGAENDIPS